MLRWLTAGESHGPALVAVIEGCPPGSASPAADVAAALARRRLGFGRGARMSFEQDEVEFLGGLRHGLTLGSPVAIRIGNTEWPKWETVMSPDPVATRSRPRRRQRGEGGRPQPAADPPRPGHADLVGMQKYGFEDARPSWSAPRARETAARVALGASRRRSSSRPTASAWSRTPWRSGPRGSVDDAGCRPRTTSTGSTPTRCGPWTPPGPRRWSPRWRRPARSATPKVSLERV